MKNGCRAGKKPLFVTPPSTKPEELKSKLSHNLESICILIK